MSVEFVSALLVILFVTHVLVFDARLLALHAVLICFFSDLQF